MFGLAAGRILSLIIDGMPHWLLAVYLVLELVFGVLGILLIKNGKSQFKVVNEPLTNMFYDLYSSYQTVGGINHEYRICLRKISHK